MPAASSGVFEQASACCSWDLYEAATGFIRQELQDDKFESVKRLMQRLLNQQVCYQ